MKRKFPLACLALCLLVILGTCACLCLSSCGEDITFKTLKKEVDASGTTVLMTSVPPTQESFNFVAEIRCAKGVSYTVSLDANGSVFGVLNSGIGSLSYGDNIFFLIVKKDGNVIANHTVNIYRNRPITVTFDDGTGKEGALTEVETSEGELLTPPEPPAQAGYDFLGWAICSYQEGQGWKDGVIPYEFSYAPQKDEIYATDFTAYAVRFIALWDARTDTPYKVEHYAENADGTFTLYETEEKTGTTGREVRERYKELKSQHLQAYLSHPQTLTLARINGDGSTVLRLYYSLEHMTLGVEHEGTGTVSGAGEYRYGEKTFTATATAAKGFVFDGWYDEATGDRLTEKTTYTYTSKKSIVARFKPDTSTSAADLFVMNGTTITDVKDMTATALAIPDGVTGIAANAFAGCTRLRSVFIPASVKTVADGAFLGCSEELFAYCEATRKPTDWSYYWDRCYRTTSSYGEHKYIKSRWNVSFE